MAQPQGNRCVLAQRATIGDRPEVELLWFIHPDNWNRGYETEIAREAVAWPLTCSHLLYPAHARALTHGAQSAALQGVRRMGAAGFERATSRV